MDDGRTTIQRRADHAQEEEEKAGAVEAEARLPR
jgi:hypothetical protein